MRNPSESILTCHCQQLEQSKRLQSSLQYLNTLNIIFSQETVSNLSPEYWVSSLVVMIKGFIKACNDRAIDTASDRLAVFVPHTASAGVPP